MQPRNIFHDTQKEADDEKDPRRKRMLSIVQFRRSRGEEMFLSYSLGLENGPGISRTGDRPPSMRRFWDHQNPFVDTTDADEQRIRTWFIDKDSADEEIKDHEERIPAALKETEAELEKARLDGDKKKTKNLKAKIESILRKLAVFAETTREASQGGIHTERFYLLYPEYNDKIIGQQGCADLTMNLWHVAYICSRLTGEKPELLWLYDEPITKRSYACLVKWKDKRVTIEEGVRFDPTYRRVMVDGKFRQDDVEFAVSGKQVIRNGESVDLWSIVHQFSDIRHLVKLPDINPRSPLVQNDKAQVWDDETGKRLRYYYGKEWCDSVWLSEKQLLEDWNLQRAAVALPVVLNRLYGGMGISIEQLEGALGLTNSKYEYATDGHGVSEQGRWQRVPWDDNLIEIHLRHNWYPWGIVGVDREGEAVLCLACNGRQGQTGYTLSEACDIFLKKAKEHGIEISSALLMDEGDDVFQKAFLEGKLEPTVPLRRRQIRSSFIFAQTR